MTLLIFSTLFNAFAAAFNMAVGQRGWAYINATCAGLCAIAIVVLGLTP